jgi:hypothetical protein
MTDIQQDPKHLLSNSQMISMRLLLTLRIFFFHSNATQIKILVPKKIFY